MWTKDSNNKEITVGALVTWNDPTHLGGATNHGHVLRSVKGGWFEVQGRLLPKTTLVKPINLTVKENSG